MSKNKWVLILFLVLAMSLAGCQEKTQSEDLISQSLIIPEEIKYRTIQAERTSYEFQDILIDRKKYVYPVGEYLTWDVDNSRLNELKKRTGNVNAGDVLATFDVEESKADLAELQLQLERQQSQIVDEKAEREAEIAAAKSDLTGLSSYELEIAKLKLEKLQISYEKYCYQAEQSISALQKQINELVASTKQTTLTAPAEGQITLEIQNPKSGDSITPGTAVYYIKYQKAWFLVVNGDIPYNAQVFFYNEEDFKDHYPENLEGAEVLYTGTVVTSPSILSDGYQETGTWVRMDTECLPEDLRKTVMFIPGEEIQGLISVPNALQEEENKRFVNILEDGVIKKRYVIWGPGETVLDGLDEGQTLILD